MKDFTKRFRSRTGGWIMAACLAIMLAVGMSSCYVDDGWYPSPPNGWNDTFYDSRLNGFWQLRQINSQNVVGYSVNYLYFAGNGRGRYYYYENGLRHWEETAYWCQSSVSGTSNYQINLQYEYSGQPSTMNYWFTNGGRSLWMQWSNSGGVQTYVYDYYPNAPW